MSNFIITGPFSADKPVTTEYHDFEVWWKEYAKTLNQRATLTWVELAWAGWFARSEVAEGKEPSVFPRKGPSE
jgi:hypothetical protein